MEKKRLRSFDALKFFGIFLVVWGHSIAWFSSQQPVEMFSYRLIYSFHMPLFMAIAGFFSAKLIDKPVRHILVNRCLPLIVPTLTLGVVIALYEHFTTGASFLDSVALSFWFLISLALCTLLYYFTMRWRRHRTLMFFVGLFISQILPPLVRYDFNIGTMYPSFMLGVFLSWNFEYLKRHVRAVFVISLICFLIMLCFLTPESMDVRFDRHHGIGPIIEFAWRYAFKLAIGLTGAVASISFFELMASVIPVSNIGDRICAMGRDTLAIYILSGAIVHTIIIKFVQLDDVDSILYQYLLTPVIAYVTIEACVLAARLIRKSDILSLLIFGETKKAAVRSQKQTTDKQ